MNDEVKKEVAKLKRLVQYRSADDAILEKTAQKIVVLRELLESGNFLDDKEKMAAKRIFENYLSKLDFENFSDLSTLSMLVYNEILASRLQRTINDSSTKDGKSYISDKLIKSLSDLTNQILSLKLKLGVDADKKEDEFSSLQLLKKRFHAWQQENKDSCTIAVPFSCQSCGRDDVKMVFLRKIVKNWEAIDHTCFQGRFYYNKTAMDMVEAGTLKKEDYAKIFNVSLDYVNWSIANRGRIVNENKASK